MPFENLSIYALAVILLLSAHVVRAARWALLFPAFAISRRFDLLLGLSLGYAINAVVPWRLGELFRIWFVAAKQSMRVSEVAGTVIAERLSDLIAVCLIALYMLFFVSADAWPLLAVPLLIAVLIIVFCVMVRGSGKSRRMVWRLVSIFNDRIRNSLIGLVWAVSELVLGGAMVKPRFLVTTAAMWLLYILSYGVFAYASGLRLPDVIFTLLGSPLQPAFEPLTVGTHTAVWALVGFTGLPVLGVLVYGGLKQLPVIFRVLNARNRYGWYGGHVALRRTRHHFKGEAEYEYFLTSLFSGRNNVATSFGLDAIGDGKVHKLFAGGSDAITAMVEVSERLLIRKFAVGQAGVKLKAQHDWLLKYRTKTFPLVEIVQEARSAESYHYDMPLVVPSNDFYDFIHTNPIPESKRVLSEVIERITGFHDQQTLGLADDTLVKKYVREKGVANATLIRDFARTFLLDKYTINGIEFDLADWEYLLDAEWLSSQVTSKVMTVVHGDLTVENIIIAPQQSPAWYIIDPNPDNVFNTCLIDWAKIMQSLHLGYEGLNRNFNCSVEDSSVVLPFTKSQAYTDLHEQLVDFIIKHRGKDVLREVYFHELINYLRLIPYKIRQDSQKGICFFSCASILLKRYLERAV
jgi:Lysylphosphatidylglycerol synthase TM region